MKNVDYAKLSLWGVSLAGGITWGLAVLILGLLSTYFNWGTEAVNVAGSVYKGYAPTVEGSLWGVVWGFVDGFIVGLVFSTIYNWFVSCCHKR